MDNVFCAKDNGQQNQKSTEKIRGGQKCQRHKNNGQIAKFGFLLV